MKTVLSTLGLVAVISILISSCAPGRVVYVTARPVVVAPPPPPFRGAVWAGPEYRMHRGHYLYVPPRYVAPRRGHVWVNGYWDHHRGKKVWVKGRWERNRRR